MDKEVEEGECAGLNANRGTKSVPNDFQNENSQHSGSSVFDSSPFLFFLSCFVAKFLFVVRFEFCLCSKCRMRSKRKKKKKMNRLQKKPQIQMLTKLNMDSIISTFLL